MMNKFLRLVACLLVMAILTSIITVALIADETQGNTDTTTDNTEVVDTNEGEAPAESEEGVLDGGADIGVEGEEAPAEGEEAPTESEEAPTESEEAPAESEEKPAEDEEKPSDDEEDEDAPAEAMTNEQALARCEFVCENEKMALYLDREFERLALVYKPTGYIHWSNCINALCDTSTEKNSLRQNRLSNLAIKYGNATDLITSSFLYSYRVSTMKEKSDFEILENGVKITYNFSTAKAKVPVYFILEEDYLDVYVVTKEIKETQGYGSSAEEEDSKSDVIVLTELALAPFMGAATPEEEGYIFVPDGSGAIIELNNGKGNYTSYSQPVYGRDITQVKEVQPDETEQALLPVMAITKGSNGLVMIASEGETFATANAAVSYSKTNTSAYNYAYFNFILRSSDNYYMTGDSATIVVFEKGNGEILVPKVGVRYYPIASEEEKVPYTDIADVYRNYLIEEKGFEANVEANRAPLYVDFWGGTVKPVSILGIPVNVKTAFTTFEQAIEITAALKDLGVDEMVVTYNDWSNDSMTSKLDTAKSVAGCLGGKGDFRDLMEYLAEQNYEFYAQITGNTFQKNGNGFMTLFNTAYRVSKSYARPYTYNIAFGTPDAGVAPALLSPKSIAKLSDKVSKNLSKLDVPGAGLGAVSELLWSDFSTKNRTNRCTTAEYIVDYYTEVKEATGKIIADAPNAYLLNSVDVINNLPLQSSQFKLSDYDIPFYQMVIHGYREYATKAINASPDSNDLFLRAIASGSNIHYDFIYAEPTELTKSSYVKLFYASYEGWLEEAAAQYKIANEILSTVSDATITGYVQDGSVITTTYSNGVVTVVDLESGEIKANGKTYTVADYTNVKEVG